MGILEDQSSLISCASACLRGRLYYSGINSIREAVSFLPSLGYRGGMSISEQLTADVAKAIMSGGLGDYELERVAGYCAPKS